MTATTHLRTARLSPAIRLNDRAFAATLAVMLGALALLPFAGGDAAARSPAAATVRAEQPVVCQLEPVVVTGHRQVAATAVVQLEPVTVTGRSARALATATPAAPVAPATQLAQGEPATAAAL